MGKTKLVDMQIDSVDLVDQGANQDAFIRLFKRRDGEPEADPDAGLFEKFYGCLTKRFQAEVKDNPDSADGEEGIEKKEAQTFSDEMDREKMQRIVGEMYDFCYALSDSLSSILCDKDLAPDAKKTMMLTSLTEFEEAAKGATAYWSEGKSAKEKEADTGIQKSAAQQAALSKLLESHGLGDNPQPQAQNDTVKKEVIDTMTIDKSKMTPEEQATLAEFEKKYGVPDDNGNGDNPEAGNGSQGEDVNKNAPAPAAQPAQAAEPQGQSTELHPEVAKALADFQELTKRQTAEMEELKKSLEIERLTAVAKKYEVLGKKADELAPKLYELKKAGSTVYDEYVALLDESLATVTKGGLFGEIGSNNSGSAGMEQSINIKAAEITKAAIDGITAPDAIIKAWEENPELAAQYDREYMG